MHKHTHTHTHTHTNATAITRRERNLSQHKQTSHNENKDDNDNDSNCNCCTSDERKPIYRTQRTQSAFPTNSERKRETLGAAFEVPSFASLLTACIADINNHDTDIPVISTATMRRETSIGMTLSSAFRSVLSVPILVLLVALALSQTKPTVAFSSTPASRWGESSTTVTTTAGRAAVGGPAVMHRVSSCRSPFGWPATPSNTVPLQQQSPCTVALWDTSGEGDDTTAPLSDANDNEAAVIASTQSLTIRQQLRKATGFSFTALRATLRKITGFSLTALRASLRAATGISLTALRISAFASTSAAVRNTMKFVLSPFPDWVSTDCVSLVWLLCFTLSHSYVACTPYYRLSTRTHSCGRTIHNHCYYYSSDFFSRVSLLVVCIVIHLAALRHIQ